MEKRVAPPYETIHVEAVDEADAVNAALEWMGYAPKPYTIQRGCGCCSDTYPPGWVFGPEGVEQRYQEGERYFAELKALRVVLLWFGYDIFDGYPLHNWTDCPDDLACHFCFYGVLNYTLGGPGPGFPVNAFGSFSEAGQKRWQAQAL